MKREIWFSNISLFRFRGQNGIVPAPRCQPKNPFKQKNSDRLSSARFRSYRILNMYGVVRKVLVAIAFVGYGNLSVAQADDSAAPAKELEIPATAHATVELVSEQLIGMLGDARVRFEENPQDFYSDIETVISPWIDFGRWSRSVMGREYAEKASEQQLDTFEIVFRKSLIETYAKGLISVKDTGYKVDPPRPGDEEKTSVAVKQTLYAGADEISVLYAMGKTESGRWQVTNVSLEGIRLRQTFQSQFKSSVIDNRGDLDKVIQNWGV